MCKSGKFNLTNFQSNNKQVLETVSPCDRRKCFVECEFGNHQSLPTETAFGALEYWIRCIYIQG